MWPKPACPGQTPPERPPNPPEVVNAPVQNSSIRAWCTDSAETCSGPSWTPPSWPFLDSWFACSSFSLPSSLSCDQILVHGLGGYALRGFLDSTFVAFLRFFVRLLVFFISMSVAPFTQRCTTTSELRPRLRGRGAVPACPAGELRPRDFGVQVLRSAGCAAAAAAGSADRASSRYRFSLRCSTFCRVSLLLSLSPSSFSFGLGLNF